ncbi:Uncharacterized protein FWK35_00027151 [Aphis craccivora]|uniref:Uncharacterized protein n=1 Tax=Aphis craccivora TaxID=307492 RepID=A0A6G0Z619_APHCR|nr:Uncharacterized protein FWK35_00027151 [Aphis craccivora]
MMSYYMTHEEISTKETSLNIKKLSTRIKTKLVPKSYLARFTDNYYINRSTTRRGYSIVGRIISIVLVDGQVCDVKHNIFRVWSLIEVALIT